MKQISYLRPAQHGIDRRFQNPVPTPVKLPGTSTRSFWAWLTTWTDVRPARPLGPFHTDAAVYNTPPVSGLRVTWLGHATLLLELDGYRLLTDPMWASYASPVQALLLKRFFAPPLPLAELPPLDAVLISHDHYDHLNPVAIRHLARTPVCFICPCGVGAILRKWGVAAEKITELNWTESTTLGADLTITAVPARHFSGRGLLNRNRTLWTAFALLGPQHRVFFGGDSGALAGLFGQIGDAYGPFDLTLLPIGAYDPHNPFIHFTPEQAVLAHQALNGQVLLPIHWGTFDMAVHPWKEPVERVLTAAAAADVRLLLPAPGQPVDVADIPATGEIVPWWTR